MNVFRGLAQKLYQTSKKTNWQNLSLVGLELDDPSAQKHCCEFKTKIPSLWELAIIA